MRDIGIVGGGVEFVDVTSRVSVSHLNPLGVGDVNGTEKGSGARFNAGKPDLSLIPLNIIAENISTLPAVDAVKDDVDLYGVLREVHEFQFTGHKKYLYSAILACSSAWGECADVFTFGKKKYSAWNWRRGMLWSIPLACIARHALKLSEGEILDADSGLPHRGHIMCNLVMLIEFCENYKEGNDLPIDGANHAKP